jgi:hypothetical protein
MPRDDYELRCPVSQGPLASLSAHLGNPFGNNILKVWIEWYGPMSIRNLCTGRRPSALHVFQVGSVLIFTLTPFCCSFFAEHRYLHRPAQRERPGLGDSAHLPVARPAVSAGVEQSYADARDFLQRSRCSVGSPMAMGLPRRLGRRSPIVELFPVWAAAVARRGQCALEAMIRRSFDFFNLTDARAS